MSPSDPWAGGELAAALRRAQDRLVNPEPPQPPGSDDEDDHEWPLTQEQLDDELEQQYRHGYL